MAIGDEEWPDPKKDFWTQVRALPPNPGQFQCKKCNAIKNENEETCYSCASNEFVQVKCTKCSSIDIAKLVGGVPPSTYNPHMKEIMQGKMKVGWSDDIGDEAQNFHCNACEFQW